MAKPLDDSDTQFAPIIFSEPISFPGRSRPTFKKRSSSDDGFDDDLQKTRRVNPHRLAARLGPEIVSDMEALIYPGAKMPSFEVRKVIQERYSVDRRHIYDYFHSRGLRVAKEDRHTNLTRGRLAKLERQAALDKTATPDNSIGDLSNGKSDEASENKLQPINLHPNLELTHISQPTSSITSPEISSQQSLNSPDQLASRIAKRMAYEKITSRHQKHEYSLPQRQDNSSTLKKGRKRKRTPAIAQPPSESLSARTPSPCPVFAPLENVLDTPRDELDFTFLDPELTLDLGDTSDLADLKNYQLNSPVILEENRPLTQTEREEIYNFINDNIGPSYGTIERVGTYCAYMNERAMHYFNRVPVGATTTYTTRVYHNAYDFGLAPCATAEDEEVDFRKWLSGCDEQDSDLESRDLGQTFKEMLSPDGRAISGSISSYSSVENLVMQRGGDCITSPSVNNVPDQLHFSYSDLNLRRSQPGSRTPTKFSAQVRATPYGHLKRTSKISADSFQNVLPSNNFSDDSFHSPDHQNLNRRFLRIPQPGRTRTTSAGGGL